MTSDKIGTSLIFPAFVPDYLGVEVDSLSKYGDILKNHLRNASDFLCQDITGFHPLENNFLTNELLSQHLQYILSCSVSDIVKRAGIDVQSCSGYSMGIYAAMYSAESIDFLSGMQIINTAFHHLKQLFPEKEFGMGVIGGLEIKDIIELINEGSYDLELSNSNSGVSFVVSGRRADVIRLLEKSKIEGALQTRLFETGIPYHSKHLTIAAKRISESINEMKFGSPKLLIFSAIDQRPVDSALLVKEEIIRNIDHGLNWHQTILFLEQCGTGRLIECGAGESLTKIGRFIGNSASYFNLKNLTKIIPETNYTD